MNMANPTFDKPMRSVWRSLLWKEWHEHKWKLAALTVLVFCGPATIVTFSDADSQSFTDFGVISGLIIPYGILAGLFIGMGTAANENHRSTMSFLQTLPIAMPKPAVVKLLLSFVVVVIPIVLLTIVAANFLPRFIEPMSDWRVQAVQQEAGNQGMSLIEIHEYYKRVSLESTSRSSPFGGWGYSTVKGWAYATVFGGSLFVGSLLLWMAACGVNRSDEIRAGAIGFLVIMLFWGLVVISLDQAERWDSEAFKQIAAVPCSFAPGSPGFLISFTRSIGAAWISLVTFSLLGHGLLAYWYLSRFGKSAVRPARTMGVYATDSSKAGWLAPPRRSQLTSMVWKQLYETAPLALTAAVAVIALTCLAYWVQDRQSPLSNEFGHILAGITMSVGFLVTLVAGIGVFLEEMKPSVGAFWRSRPIHLPVWFGVKFLTGLLVLAISFGLLLLAANWLLDQEDRLTRDFASDEFAWSIGSIGLTFSLIYSLGMTSYCLTRHPVLAAMSSIALFFVGLLAFQYFAESNLSRGATSPLHIFCALLSLQAVATTFAYLTVRNNWGWHK